MSKKRRKRPGKHTVHTRDSRYNVPSYPRGEGELASKASAARERMEGRYIVSAQLSPRDLQQERYINAYRNAWNTNEGLDYGEIGRMTDRELAHGIRSLSDMAELNERRALTRARVRGSAGRGERGTRGKIIYSRESVLDKATVIYANSEEEARSKVEERFGKVKKVEPLGVNHMGNPYYRVTFIPQKKKSKSRRGVPKSKKYPFYSDPEHGWLKVPIKELKSLGIEDQISSYSYMRGKFAYLEEDSDATLFVKAVEAKGGKVNLDEHIADKRSKIRGYSPFKSNKRDAVITNRSQETPGPYGEALHDVWITVDDKHYYVPSVPGNTIDYNKNKNTLRDLIKLSGTETRERSMGSMSIRGSRS